MPSNGPKRLPPGNAEQHSADSRQLNAVSNNQANGTATQLPPRIISSTSLSTERSSTVSTCRNGHIPPRIRMAQQTAGDIAHSRPHRLPRQTRRSSHLLSQHPSQRTLGENVGSALAPYRVGSSKPNQRLTRSHLRDKGTRLFDRSRHLLYQRIHFIAHFYRCLIESCDRLSIQIVL